MVTEEIISEAMEAYEECLRYIGRDAEFAKHMNAIDVDPEAALNLFEQTLVSVRGLHDDEAMESAATYAFIIGVIAGRKETE